MGGAQSQNVANAVSTVSNDIKNLTSVNNYQQNNNQQIVDINKCLIEARKEFIINFSSQLILRSEQITQVKNQTSLYNSVQQSVLQQAMSKIGSMGVGFASATNNTSLFCSLNNNIINSVQQGSSQFSNTVQQFACKDSVIITDKFNISFNNVSDFYNKQILDNSSVNDVTNEITQSITQKASATVEGLTGFLIGIALIIAALGYAIAKPLSSGSTKIIVTVILIFLIILLLAFMYIRSTPPLFAEPEDCALYSMLGNPDCDECINPSMKSFKVKAAPIKYLYALMPDNNSVSGLEKTSLFELCIVSAAGPNPNNAGYTMNTYNVLQENINNIRSMLTTMKTDGFDKDTINILNYINTNGIPNLLTNPSGVNGKFIQIPQQFILSSGDGTQSQSKIGTCTPGKFTYGGAVISTPSQWQKCEFSGQWTLTNADYTQDSTMGISNSNLNNFNTWISTLLSKVENKNTVYAFVRFILVYLLNKTLPGDSKFDQNVFQNENELVYFYNPKNNLIQINQAKNVREYCLEYITTQGNNDFQNGNNSTGSIKCMAGICNTKQYKFQTFMRKIGIWLVFLLLVGTFLTMYFNNGKKTKQNKFK
jgi:hypothetical protein